MRKAVVVLLFLAVPLYAGDVQQFEHDVKSMGEAPFHWTSEEWTHFAEGSGLVAALVIADPRIEDWMQRHRSTATDRFSRTVTPWGGQRAVDLSLLLYAGGALLHDDNLASAGRDAFESELWAGTIVTPVIKRIGGRARPYLGKGAYSLQPEQGHLNAYSSFPSGHATNAFATATAIAEHYDGVVPYIAYAVATGVAFSRVNDRVHWTSDVVAGALIGHTIAKSFVAHNRRVQVSPVVTPRGAGMLFDIHR